MTEFRLIHISDLHLSQKPSHQCILGCNRLEWYLRTARHRSNPLYPTTYCPDLAAKLARQVTSRDDLDAVLLTGDVATTGRIDDLTEALHYLDGRSPREWSPRRPIPALRSKPMIVIPGNHDRFVHPRWRPSGDSFEKVFSDTWDVNAEVYDEFVGPSVGIATFTKSSENLAVISADFCLRDDKEATGQWGYLGQGKVHDDVLNDLIQATRELQEDEERYGIVWAVHFPPRFPNVKASLRLLDEEKLIRAASDLQVPLIFAGHTHEAIAYPLPDSSARVVCAGSATGFAEPHNSFFDVLLSCDNGEIRQVRTVRYSYHEKRGLFAPDRDESWLVRKLR